MWRPVRVLVMVAALLAAGLGAAVSAAAATTSAPTLITSNYACSNGTCEVGPGNVGIAFGSELNATGALTLAVSGCTYAMSVTSGSLPPGLQLGGPQFGEDCDNIISGTPTQAGTYPFTVKIQLQPNSLGQPGPSGTRKLTITIGTGSSDRLANVSAGYNEHTRRLSVDFYDANIGALYSVSVTATGKQVFAPQSLPAPGDVLGSTGTDPCSGLSNPCNLSVTNSLGSSATVPLVIKY
jgi:Putative Ig domain